MQVGDVRWLTDEEVVDLIFSLPETCVLDVTDLGGLTLEDLAGILRLTHQAVNLLEEKALGRLRRHLRRQALLRGRDLEEALAEGFVERTWEWEELLSPSNLWAASR